MQRSRRHSPPARGRSGGGGSSKTMLLGLIALVLLGVAYVFMYIQTMMFKGKLDGALSEKVINTVQYNLLSAPSVKKRLGKVARELKLVSPRYFVTIQTRDDFSNHGSYYLRRSLLGFKNAQSMRSDKVPGCSNIDALMPGTSLKSLSSSTAAGQGSMVNRVGAAAAKDGKAMVTGDAPTTSAPPGSLIFAIDVVFTFKYMFFKRKMWFHRRCYLYPQRRRHQTVDQISPVLTGKTQ